MGIRKVKVFCSFRWELDSFGNWYTGHADYIPAKNLSKFCHCPEIFHGVEFKDDRLVHMAEGISYMTNF